MRSDAVADYVRQENDDYDIEHQTDGFPPHYVLSQSNEKSRRLIELRVVSYEPTTCSDLREAQKSCSRGAMASWRHQTTRTPI